MFIKICPQCKTRLDEFYNTGMLGCPYCYKAFEQEIRLALKKIQGRDFHTGKTPNHIALDKELINDYNRLIKDKETALLEGRFDEVARLSEEILFLSDELKKRGLI